MASFDLTADDDTVKPPRRAHGDLVAAIDGLLDLVQRPVGARRGYVLLSSPEADRAIVAMFDAVGRNP